MSNVTQMVPLQRQQLLEALDRFKDKIESGEMTGYFLVGVGPKDELCPMWGASGSGITILRGLGAIECLKHKFVTQINWNIGHEG